MERVPTLLLWPLLGLSLWLVLQVPGTQATGRRLSYPDPLPRCSQVPGGISGSDCHDPPSHPLPPCDFHHQRIGFDCSGWPPVSLAGAASPRTFQSKTRPLLERRTAIDLPPCSQGSGGTSSWDCYDVPTHPLPPCDILHHIIGFDCSGWPPKWPPAVASDVREASPATVKSEKKQENGGHVEEELPPCSQVPGGIPGWNCYDQPKHSLPPCDFHHQRIGFDCSGWPPAAAH